MPIFVLAIFLFLINKLFKVDAGTLFVLFIALAIAIAILIARDKNKARDHQAFLDRLTPEGLAKYEEGVKEAEIIKEALLFKAVYGDINPHLICPHCQTKGAVHAIKGVQDVVSTGQIGGILKTNTKSTVVNHYTQHHCAQCKTTWNV